MIIDRLYETVAKKGPICVGLDTKIEYVPDFIKKTNTLKDSIYKFNKRIIDLTKNYTAIYKPQLAYYEALGIEGMKAYRKTLKYLRKNNCLILSDVKRGDISATASMYAQAYFSGDFESDFITLNPYMGYDSLTPYFEYIEKKEKGVFILLRTSNQGAMDIECQKIGDQYLYEKVGHDLQEFAQKFKGACGYSSLGLVVGGTHTQEAEKIRTTFKDMYFLIPGYGAQGGSGADALLYLENGNGGIVNSSRGIIASPMKEDAQNKKTFDACIEKAIQKMRRDLNIG